MAGIAFGPGACGGDKDPAGADDDDDVDEGGGVDAGGTGTGDGPRVESAACRFDVPADLGSEGADYACGDLLALEDRAQPDGRVLRLHFVRFFGAADTGAATVYLDGGPGGDGSSILFFLDETLLGRLLANGDLLVLGQRGTNLSQPSLRCTDPLPACADRLSQVAHLPAFNTAANADDVDDLRRALGYDRLNLYGISYGSRLALEVLRRHGDGVGVAIIDGNVPAQVHWQAEIAVSFHGALTALDAACADDAACSAAYGDLTDAFIAGVTALNEQPVVFDFDGEQVPISGDIYAALLFQLMYSSFTYPILPLYITDLAQRRTDRIAGFLSFLLGSFEQEEEQGTISDGLYYSVVCGELFNPPDPDAFDAASAAVPAAIAGAFRPTWNEIVQACDAWPKGAPDPTLRQPVVSAVPTFVSSGALDPITPPRYGDIAAETLSDSTVVVFASSGHGATVDNDCGRQTFSAFLADPEAALDTSCKDEIGIEFELPSALVGARMSMARLRADLARAPVPPPLRRKIRDAIRRR